MLVRQAPLTFDPNIGSKTAATKQVHTILRTKQNKNMTMHHPLSPPLLVELHAVVAGKKLFVHEGSFFQNKMNDICGLLACAWNLP